MSEFYDRTVPSVWGLAMRILDDRAKAEEIVAEVYFQAWQRADARDCAAEGVMSWLLAMCRDHALAALQRQGAMPKTSGCPDLLGAINPGSALHARLASLSLLQRELVGLALFRGMDHTALSLHAGISIDGVISELTDAANRMRATTPAEPAAPTLESIILTPQLYARPSRPSDFQAEARAMEALTQEFAKPCGRILGRLVEAALELCHAHSAGISILENADAGLVFRWHAIAGEFAPHLGGSLPRDESPCGIVLDRNATQLMAYPDRYFANLRGASPRIVEVLLVPFHMLGEPVGTVWVLSHHEGTHFCAEDCRVITALANFAAAAYLLRSSQEAAVEARDEMMKSNERLRPTNETLATTLSR